MSIKSFDKLLPKKRSGKAGAKKGVPHQMKSQARLNALAHRGVKPGGMLNPYGTYGNTFRSRFRLGDLDHLAWRPEAMKRNRRRKRIQLIEKKKVALEMHELQQLARENAVAAMQTLIDISQNERAPEPSRIAASSVILDRGYGKSSQVSISANVTNGKANELTGDELEKRIRKALERVEAATNRTPKAPEGEERSADLRKLN